MDSQVRFLIETMLRISARSLLARPGRRVFLAGLLTASFGAVSAAAQVDAPAPGASLEEDSADAVQGRIEEHANGFSVLRVWGGPHERGYAHGRLMAARIAAGIRAEFRYRFLGQSKLLEVAKTSMPRLITYPDGVRAEIEGLYAGLVASGVELRLEDFDRDIDLDDLLFVNALDVFAMMGCSGFTAWGDRVEGGGVLTTRNFDWTYSGPHMTDGTIVLVQEPLEGRAFATVTIPGFVGVLTGVDEAGCSVFLHVGSGEPGAPEPDSMPTATAAREILQFGPEKTPARFEFAAKKLEYTSPPSSYLVRVVTADAKAEAPVAVFETTTDSVRRVPRDEPCVVTNHFFEHRVGGDSKERYRQVFDSVTGCFEDGDRRVSVDEAWTAMKGVERSGRSFASLHSLVFRHEPWVFELRVGTGDERGGVLAAPSSSRRFSPRREELFRERWKGPADLAPRVR